jgi:hypothetical protein
VSVTSQAGDDTEAQNPRILRVGNGGPGQKCPTQGPQGDMVNKNLYTSVTAVYSSQPRKGNNSTNALQLMEGELNMACPPAKHPRRYQ